MSGRLIVSVFMFDDMRFCGMLVVMSWKFSLISSLVSFLKFVLM